MQRILNGTLTIHNTDTEQLAHKALKGWERTVKTRLNQQDHEDLLTELITTTWQLSQKYNPQRHNRFDAYAYPLLILRAHDWLRQKNGRTTWKFNGHTHHRPPRQQPLSLDAPTTTDTTLRLLDLVGNNNSSDPTNRNETLERLEHERDSHRTQDLNTLRRNLYQPLTNRTAERRT